jgi:hypothetical protein
MIGFMMFAIGFPMTFHGELRHALHNDWRFRTVAMSGAGLILMWNGIETL